MPARSTLLTAILSFCVASALPRGARGEVRSPEVGRFRSPPERLPLPVSSPSLAEPEHARRAYELGLGAGVVHRLCPPAASRCDGAAGPGFELGLAARSVPHFAWGLTLSHATFGEELLVGDTTLSLRESATGLRLGGTLFANANGVFDPYVEFGAGGGRVVTRGWLSNGTRVGISNEGLAPLLAAATGLRFLVLPEVALGARFSWTHWLLAPHERCNSVAFGVCTQASSGHFDVGNAVWHWQLSGTFLFGAPH